MKYFKIIKLLICAFLWTLSYAQSPIGAWEKISKAENGDTIKTIVIFTEGFQSVSVYNETTGEFLSTNGGTWSLDGDVMTEKVEFNSNNPSTVGEVMSFEVEITESTIQIVGSDRVLKRLDNGSPGQLNGAWLMSGRVKDGEMQTRDTDRPRKTMKILSGTRFQWIAYNTETKKFMATGGGTYTTKDGKYVESIEFFSKDNSRVGMSLEFDFELIDGNWQHKGFSSKGDPIHEIWTSRK